MLLRDFGLLKNFGILEFHFSDDRSDPAGHSGLQWRPYRRDGLRGFDQGGPLPVERRERLPFLIVRCAQHLMRHFEGSKVLMFNLHDLGGGSLAVGGRSDFGPGRLQFAEQSIGLVQRSQVVF